MCNCRQSLVLLLVQPVLKRYQVCHFIINLLSLRLKFNLGFHFVILKVLVIFVSLQLLLMLVIAKKITEFEEIGYATHPPPPFLRGSFALFLKLI